MLLCCGCAEPQVFVTLPDRFGQAPAPQVQPVIWSVGNVTVEPPEFAEYSPICRDRLGQRLAAMQNTAQQGSPAAGDGDQATLRVDAAVKVLHAAKASERAAGATKIEITFNLVDAAGSRLIRSTMLASPGYRQTDGAEGSDARPADDRDLIAGWCAEAVDIFLANLYRQASSVEVPLANGRSQFDRRGRALAAKGDYPGALASFRRAIDAAPGDHAALYNAGVVCEAMGDLRRANRFYRRAARLSDNSTYRTARDRVGAAWGE